MINFLIFLFAIFYLILAKLRLDWAVLLIIITLPSYLIRFSFFGLPATLLELMIWLAFLVWGITNYRELKANIKRIFKKDKNLVKVDYPFKWEIILLLIISFIAVAVAGFASSALGIWKAYFFEPILFYILVLNVFYNANDTNEMRMTRMGKIILALAVSAFAVALLAIYQTITGQLIDNSLWQAAATRRVVSFFGYPNAVGLFLGPLVLLFLGYLVDIFYKNYSQIFNFQFSIFKKFSIFNFQIILISFIIILSCLAVFFAKSEGAIAGVAVGLIIFGLLAGKKARWATIILVVIVFSGIYFYQPAQNYFVKKITLHDLSGEIRREQWRETLNMLQGGRQISGAGLANYQTAIAPYHKSGIYLNLDNDPEFAKMITISLPYQQAHWQPTEIYLYPHNIFLNFWSELGLAGLLLFVWIIGKFLYLGVMSYELRVTSYKYINIGLICAMAVIVVHGLVDVPYFKNDLAVMFWLLLGLMGMIDLANKAEVIKRS